MENLVELKREELQEIEGGWWQVMVGIYLWDNRDAAMQGYVDAANAIYEAITE